MPNPTCTDDPGDVSPTPRARPGEPAPLPPGAIEYSREEAEAEGAFEETAMSWEDALAARVVRIDADGTPHPADEPTGELGAP